ncbi:glycosyltransferase like family 2-domain-containing protein [Lentinula aciculospora]|uniref:Ceramide glucosyltransferase n=1 Tax=Lentinula aciculospora TaxID=153920 RepID=A0A9W9ANJ3_9AGAR|nr:glycosyltransferase like family 2-domain-containing protein [Lentinula aciculospora]
MDLDSDDYHDFFASLGLIWFLALWTIWLLGTWAARNRYRLRPRSPLSSAARTAVPGVSILRPLKGLDTNLYENLESTFTQEYPNFEILLCIADEDDQALPVVRELISKYPNVNAKVLIGVEDVGVNPKVNNLMGGYRSAANDILWILDSNVTVHSGTLARSVDALQTPTKNGERVALVHHVPFAFSTESRVGSRIEEAFLNTNHAKMYLAINTVAIESCVVGKSNLYRRSDLERVNGSLKRITSPEPNAKQDGLCGLPAFGRFLAEDNMIASALWHELGLRHDLSCDVARNVVGNMSLRDYIQRRIRWIRVRKHMVFAATMVEPLTESIVLVAIGSSSLKYLFGFSRWLYILVHFCMLLVIDLDVYTSLSGHPLPQSIKWEFLAGWVTRELLALPIFIIAIFGNTVEWRGRTYQVLKNGEVQHVSNHRSFLNSFAILRWYQPQKYQVLATDPVLP